MKCTYGLAAALLVAGAAALGAQAKAQAPAQGTKAPEMKMSAVPKTPEWERLKSLVGNWEGTMGEGGKQMPTTVEVRMTGDGSAIMHVLDKGGPYEMVTMIHPDGKRLLATHYCAAHNQPRMALVPSTAANKVAFSFVDGTNIGPGEEHMTGVVFTFVDADHHEEAWTSSGSPEATVFKYARKK
jgi:hypothetical protein